MSYLFELNLIYESLKETVFFDIAIKVLSSFIFIFLLLYGMRPKVKISPYICYQKMGSNNQYYYIFKIVNKSSFYTFDVHINLVKKEPYMVNKEKKINNRITQIKISSNYINHLPKSKRKINYGDHAYLIRTKYNLKKDILDKDITISLSISSKHGLTNLTRVVSQDFLTSQMIIEDKEFKFGKHLDTI